jgi:hypothetical protein
MRERVFLPLLAGLSLVAQALPTAVAVGQNLPPLAGLVLAAPTYPTAFGVRKTNEPRCRPSAGAEQPRPVRADRVWPTALPTERRRRATQARQGR